MTCSTPTRLHLVPALPSELTDDTVDFDLLEREQSLPALREFGGGVDAAAAAGDSSAGPRGRRSRRNRLRLVGDRGMATAEYAVGLIAACAFAVVLYHVVKSGDVFDALLNLAKGALKAIAD